MSKKKHKKQTGKAKAAAKKEETAKAADQEQVLDFQEAKDMTVEEAAKKQGEIEAGITEDDGLLDRYIKQHREEIEADKFETKQLNQLPRDLNQKIAEIEATPADTPLTGDAPDQPAAEPAAAEPAADSAEKTAEAAEDLAETKVMPVPVAETAPAEPEADTPSDQDAAEIAEPAPAAEPAKASAASPVPPVFDDLDDFDDDDEEPLPFYKNKKVWIGLVGFLAFLGIAWTVYLNYSAALNSGKNGASSASSRTSRTSSSSSGEESAALKEFNNLYGSFFTDEGQTNLKNDSFDQLSALEEALKALEGTADYEAAKEKFDKLKAAIEATQAVNSQFDKPVVVNGEIDQTATAKPDASFTAPSTGLAEVDKNLTAAINFGRSQLSSAAGGDTGGGTASGGDAGSQAAPAAPAAPAQPANNATLTNGLVLNYAARIVYGSDQVNLQRELSRVPYSDEAIADANNAAWQFAPGVLERIIAVSNQRGYFAGNEFILEKVNIINGRGYYNLFKTDGTYLFSINAQTGYFVGNAAGNSDSLDF